MKFALQGRKVEPEHKEMVTVYFSDIAGFTTISAGMSSSKVDCAEVLDLLGLPAKPSLSAVAPRLPREGRHSPPRHQHRAVCSSAIPLLGSSSSARSTGNPQPCRLRTGRQRPCLRAPVSA